MSNTFSLTMIQDEFGGDTPVSLSHYYSVIPLQPGNPINFSSLQEIYVQRTSIYGSPHTCIRSNNGYNIWLNPVANFMNNTSNTIPLLEDIIPNFFRYEYPTTDSNIRDNIPDGSNDMFDNGNYITVLSDCIGVQSNAAYNNIPYGDIVTENTHGVYVSGVNTWPHLTMVYIQSDTVGLQSSGNTGSDGSATVSNIDVQTYSTSNNRYGQIWTNMNGNAGDPSIIDTWFTICKSNWSSLILDIDDQRKQTDSVEDYNQAIRVQGSNFILCKALFALSNGEMYSDPEPITNFVTSFVEGSTVR